MDDDFLGKQGRLVRLLSVLTFSLAALKVSIYHLVSKLKVSATDIIVVEPLLPQEMYPCIHQCARKKG